MLTEGFERRRYRRYPLEFDCSIRSSVRDRKAGGAPIKTVAKDISRGGLYLEISGGFEVGSEIECSIELPPDAIPGGKPGPIRCRGKIVRVEALEKGRTGIGVRVKNLAFVLPTE